jgi:predicted nuclease of predicted toxin-antitoxin system
VSHATEFVRDIGLGAAPDGAVAARARETRAAIVTRDLDFADIRQYPPGEYAGIMVLRLPDDSTARDICQVLLRFMNEANFVAALDGRLAIVEELEGALSAQASVAGGMPRWSCTPACATHPDSGLK